MNKYEQAVKRFQEKAQKGEKLSRTTAVRMKCLDCCCYQVAEVTKCPCVDCPLYCFRMGRDESGTRKKRLSKKS